MLLVRCNRAQFEYDIHALIKAFYPEWEVRLLTPESVVKDKKLKEHPAGMEIIFEADQVQFLVNCQAMQTEREQTEREQTAQEQTGKEQTGRAQTEQAQVEQGIHRYLWSRAIESQQDYKNSFKRFLYTSLREETGISLPWGILTGIRPTKLAMSMLEQGEREAQIQDYLQTNYLVSAQKAGLSVEIAVREKAILDQLHYEDGYSLYIGIPFCPTTCLYCSFTSFPIRVWKDRVSDYLDALEKEIDYIAEAYRHKILDTIYIGGGTPSSLSAEELDRLLGKITASFPMESVQEFTVEAGRADSITRDKLRTLSRYGVTRISINPQTMKEQTLRLIGRQHTVEQVAEAFALAREEGFDNINMDIILGLPGEDEKDVAATIAALEALEPDSLTVHSLAVKRASRLNQWIEENGISTMRNTEETMRIADEGADRMGMAPYYLYRQKNMSGNFENVGYAKDGKYGIYNILIMEEKQTIVALGAGTVTKRVDANGRIERCDTVKDVAQYIERIDEMIERKRKLFEG